jgi:uncharacterized membrane protein
MRRIIASVALVLAILNSGHRAYAVSFDSLGLIDSDVQTEYGHWTLRPAVSGDGSTVAASSGLAGFTWTRTGGKVPLPSWSSCIPRTLSYDGSVVAGVALQNTGFWDSARWVENQRVYIDGGFAPTGVSASGAVVVGTKGRSYGAYKWIQGAAWDIPMTQLATGMGVSADGMIIAGNVFTRVGDWGTTVPSARIWNNWVVTEVGSLTEGTYAASYTFGISPNGNVIFGYSSSTQAFLEGFRWNVETGMEGVGMVPGWASNHYSWMLASNYDGSVMVGVAEPDFNKSRPENERAIMWDAQHGIRFVDDVLTNDFGLDLTGWQLRSATGISWDGTTIVGYGVGPQGNHEGWVATIPEPATVLLLACGLAAGARRRRSRVPR